MKTSVSKILGLMGLLLPAAAFAANTSVTQPEGLIDLTTSDASKVFSVLKPNAKDWLAYNNGEYSLDYTHAFDNGAAFDRSDRCIINAGAADFGYTFDQPTVVNAYKIYLPKDDGIGVNDRAPGKWTFEGSDDKESWTTLDTRGDSESETDWGASSDTVAARFYTFDNTTPYRHYRLNVSQTVKADAGYLQLAELEFFDRKTTVDPTDFASHQDFKIAGLEAGVEERDLPVLVRVATAKLTGLRADGKDICFAQGEDHDRLPYEIESWDPEGDAFIWVCVKKVARGESFTMLWGSENDYATRSRYTWSGYTSVVHFSDSTKPVVSSVDAKTGACVDSKWTGNGYVAGGVDGPKTRIATPFAALADKSKFTASVWIKPGANSATTRLISSKGGYGEDGMELIFVPNAGIYVRGNKSDKTYICKATNGEAMPINTWIHYTAVLDGEAVHVFQNGVEMSGEGSINKTTFSNDKNAMLGGYNGTGTDSRLTGVMDEFRLYNGVQTAQRAKAEYLAMDPATFLTTEAIPSVLTVTSVVSAEDEAKLSVDGLVSFGEGVEQETVVIALGATREMLDLTYEIPLAESGAFAKTIDDLPDGRYYLSVGLKDVAASWTAKRLVRIGTIAPIGWTGSGDGTNWNDPANWEGSVVPEEIDTALFGEGVNADLTVTVEADARADRIRVTTPYKVRLGATAMPMIAAMDVETVEGAGKFSYVANVSLAEGCVVDVAEGTEVSFAKMPSAGDLVKRGAGKVTFSDAEGERTGGTTTVEAGRLEFGGGKNLLGATLIVGGFGAEAVAYSTFANGWNYSPMSSQSAVIEIRDQGLLDLSRTQESPTFQTFSKIAVRKGGVLNLGHTKINVAGGGDSYVLEGTILADTNADLLMQGGRVVVSEEIDAPVVLPCGLRTRVATLQVSDATDVPVELTIQGRLESSNWPVSDKDGIIKTDTGVLRLAGSSAYGGYSAYEGTTVINGGTVLADNVKGSATGKSTVRVNAGGTLGGCGTIGGLADSPNANLVVTGNATAKAVVHPGSIADETGAHVAGTLTAGSAEQACAVAFNANSELKINVGRKGAIDALVVHGAVTVAEGATLSLAVAEDVSANQVRGGTYTILSATDGIAGDFSEILAPKKSWKVKKVMGKVTTEEGEDEAVVALTVTIPGSFVVVIR